MKGLITKSTGSWYWIKDEQNALHQARIRGKFRLDNIKHTNPIAVGDEVDFELDQEGNAVIHQIYERKNYIIRRSVNLSKRSHIIASNIDLAFLLVTIDNPRTSFGFIDRFLVTAEAYHIPTMILFNKMDTYDEIHLQLLKIYEEIYTSINYPFLEISAKTGFNLEKLKELMLDKTSLFSGHSGSGKSTLLNALSPNLNLKTAEISDFNKKGQHTTTFAQMYDLPFGGRIIDTPGIKEFGLVDIEKEELQGYFPEIFALKRYCKFDNCLHLNEPKCAVIKAVEEEKIAESRYESYLTFLEETE